MESKAVLHFLRMTPRKTRAVADIIRGRNCSEALEVLRFLPKAAKVPLEKTLKSAIANVINQTEKGKVDTENLWVKAVHVDSGATLKRYRPRARGRADLRRKRTCHVSIEVEERV